MGTGAANLRRLVGAFHLESSSLGLGSVLSLFRLGAPLAPQFGKPTITANPPLKVNDLLHTHRPRKGIDPPPETVDNLNPGCTMSIQSRPFS